MDVHVYREGKGPRWSLKSRTRLSLETPPLCSYRCTRQVAGRNPEQVFTKPAVAFLPFLSIPYISSLLPPPPPHCLFLSAERDTILKLPFSLFVYSFVRGLLYLSFCFVSPVRTRVYASSSGGPHPSRHFDEHSN